MSGAYRGKKLELDLLGWELEMIVSRRRRHVGARNQTWDLWKDSPLSSPMTRILMKAPRKNSHVCGEDNVCVAEHAGFTATCPWPGSQLLE